VEAAPKKKVRRHHLDGDTFDQGVACAHASPFAIIQPIYQATDHLGNNFQFTPKFSVFGVIQEASPAGYFKKWHAFLR